MAVNVGYNSDLLFLKITEVHSHYCSIQYCNTVQLSLLSKDCIGRNKTKVSFNSTVFFVYQYLLLAGQAPVSGHLSPTPLVAAYENHSRKRPAPVTDIFIPSRGCPLTRALTVSRFTGTGRHFESVLV